MRLVQENMMKVMAKAKSAEGGMGGMGGGMGGGMFWPKPLFSLTSDI